MTPKPEAFTRRTAAVLSGSWFRAAAAERNAIAQTFYIGAYPCRSLVIITVNLIAL